MGRERETKQKRESKTACNSHRLFPANKARSVLPQVQRERGGEKGVEEKGMNEEKGRERGRKGGRERRRKRRDEGAAYRPLIPSNIPLDDRARTKER